MKVFAINLLKVVQLCKIMLAAANEFSCITDENLTGFSHMSQTVSSAIRSRQLVSRSQISFTLHAEMK